MLHDSGASAPLQGLRELADALDDQRPRDLLLQGKLERLSLVLRLLNLGLSV